MNRDELPYDAFGDYSDIDKSDLISRAVVIKYIDRLRNSGTGKKLSLEYIRKFVENLPSVEPSRLHCVNCKYYNYEFECMMWHNTHIRPYEDYCSRLEPSEFVELRGAE